MGEIREAIRHAKPYRCVDCVAPAVVIEGRVRVAHDPDACPSSRALRTRHPGLFAA